MKAYDCQIVFDPMLQGEENIDTSSKSKVVFVRSGSRELLKNYRYKQPLISNQDRELALYMQKNVYVEENRLWAFEVAEVATFFWKEGEERVTYICGEQYSDDLLKYWAIHTVTPLFFTIAGRYDFLHAGSVKIDEGVLLLVAESFGGKSTLTDFFLKQGHALLSDDKVGTYIKNGSAYAVPSHPYHRPYRQMEDLGYLAEHTVKEPQPIHAIYALQKCAPDSPVKIRALHGVEKFTALRSSSEINLTFLKEKRFTYLSRIAKIVPVFEVSVPWGIEYLGDVYEEICMHIRASYQKGK